MKIVAQRADGDCGIAALSTLTGESYEDVYVAVAGLDARRGKRGLRNSDVVRAAAAIGLKLSARRKFDLDDDEGILAVNWTDPKRRYSGHFVVLYRGIIVDPQGPVVLPHEEWFTQNDCRPVTLLTDVVR